MRRNALFLLVCAVAAAGCGKGQPPVVRLPLGTIEKAVFDGEWYFLQTVIDTPYSAGYTFVGEQGDLEKIVWEVQEDFLIARRSYEHIAGSEPDGIAGSTESGAAVAMYAIISHFDIRCEYNPATGECLNVISANDSDRPWNEREFMEVDWSRNLITDSEFLVLARIFDGIEMEPVAYYVQEPGHPHAPRFEGADIRELGDVDVVEQGADPVGYIDIVNKMFVRPTSVEIDGLGQVPSCFLLYQDHLDCAPGEITVRNSFLRVDEDERDYQPMVYTGDRMDRFGYFVTERAGYDPRYGVVEPSRFRFANRHNLWQQSHRRDGAGELVRCTENEECGGGGSVCDLDWARAQRATNDAGQFLGACTLPYRERQVRPVTYHVSQNFPADLLPDMEHVASEWNRAFTATVGSLREQECLADGGDAGGCAAERTRDEQVYVLCHNPVGDGDNPACGEPGTSAQIGDLRYSLIGWVNEPHLSSPLGYGPSAADPETGELIMGNAFIYGAGVETTSAFGRDIVALLNGDIDFSDITSGDVVQSWVDRQRAPGSEVTGRPADDHITSIDGFNVARVNQAMDFSWARELGTSAFAARGRPSSPAEVFDRWSESEERLADNGAFGNGDELGRARLSNLLGTDIERMMTNEEMRVAAGVDPTLPVTDQVLELASPLRSRSIESIYALEQARLRIEREACIIGTDFADDGLLGIAREIDRAAASSGVLSFHGTDYVIVTEDGRLDQEQVRAFLRHPIFHGLVAHEIGHTLGLRHNFSGSYDALNYNARYWELRDDGRMEPRAWDPLTEQEIDGRIREQQYSTVMDYGNNFVVTDSEGIGHYDVAAIKMGYGDLVEVFANAAEPSEMAWVVFMQDAGWPERLKISAFTGGELTAYAYTELPGILGGVDRLEQRADVPYTSLTTDDFLARNGIDMRVLDPQGRPMVPYLFCSDEQADLDGDCLRYDAGADRYETLTSIIDNYWNYYIFNAYRRERIGFNTGSYSDRVLTRYYRKLAHSNQVYSLFRGIFQDVFGDGEDVDRFFERQDGLGAFTAGVGAGFELLTRVITTPEPGRYGNVIRGDGSEALLEGGGESRIDGFDGRSLETTWDFDAGYFWFDQLDRAGFYYDKTLALMVLMDPETHFLGRDTAADVRRYQINFYSSFGPSVTGFLRGVVGEDWAAVAPRLMSSGDLVFPDPLELAIGDMAGVPVDPNASFSIQLFAATYGMSLIPDTFDQGYFNSSRIFVRGGAEGVDIAPGIAVVEFTDPDSGLTYVAPSSVVGGEERNVGAQMLLHAQALSDHGARAELRRYIDNIDLVRRLSWLLAFGD